MEEEQNTQAPEAAQTPVIEKSGFNITSMILGIIGLVFIWVWYIMLPCSIIAIIFSIAGRKDASRVMGIAGLVLGIITLVLWVLFFICGLFFATASITFLLS